MTPNDIEKGKYRDSVYARAAGPHIDRDWSDTNPGDYFSADDETSNEYVYDEVDGEISVGVVQNLVMHDFYTGNPLGSYHYFGAPTGLAIRLLCYDVFVNKVGLPFKGVLFENSGMRTGLGQRLFGSSAGLKTTVGPPNSVLRSGRRWWSLSANMS